MTPVVQPEIPGIYGWLFLDGSKSFKESRIWLKKFIGSITNNHKWNDPIRNIASEIWINQRFIMIAVAILWSCHCDILWIIPTNLPTDDKYMSIHVSHHLAPVTAISVPCQTYFDGSQAPIFFITFQEIPRISDTENYESAGKKVVRKFEMSNIFGYGL